MRHTVGLRCLFCTDTRSRASNSNREASNFDCEIFQRVTTRTQIGCQKCCKGLLGCMEGLISCQRCSLLVVVPLSNSNFVISILVCSETQLCKCRWMCARYPLLVCKMAATLVAPRRGPQPSGTCVHSHGNHGGCGIEVQHTAIIKTHVRYSKVFKIGGKEATAGPNVCTLRVI